MTTIDTAAEALAAMDARSIENPAVPLTSFTVSDYLGLSGAEAAGVTVNENTAMTTSAVWAAVQLLAGAVGMLPVGVFRKGEHGREALPNHPIARLLDIEVNADMTRQVMLEALMANALLYGRGPALIEWGQDMRPRALYPLPADKLAIERRGGLTQFTIHDPRAGVIVLRPTDVLYIPGMTTDGITGISPVRKVSGAVGVTIAAEQQAGAFFKNGSRPGGVLQHPGKLSPEASKRLRISWEKLHEGAQNAFKTAILEEGLQYAAVGITPKDSQLLEARKFQVIEVARIFGVPPHMLQDLDRATFSNIEHQGIQFVTYGLARWLTRLESEMRRKLFRESEKADHFVKFNANALMRGDAGARAEFYTKMVAIRAMSPNEVRALEDMNPYDGGDVYENPNTSTAAGDDADPPDSDDGDAVRSAWKADAWGRLRKHERDKVMPAVRKHLFHGEGQVPHIDKFDAWAGEYYRGLAERIDRTLEPLGIAGEGEAYTKKRAGEVREALSQPEPGDAVAALFTEQ